MAAELASDNKTKMENTLGRPVSATDLYLAHFLGLSGSLRFIDKMETDPATTGASMFPRAAAANQSVFYTSDGRALTLNEIYGKLESNMTSGQAAFAALSNAPTDAVAAGARAMSGTAAASTATGAGTTLQGFSNPGSILSPLMLVTLAALPVAPESANQNNGSTGLRHSAVRPSLPSGINPMTSLGMG
jgi:hypothetical protein